MKRYSLLISLALGLLAIPISWAVPDLVLDLNSLPTVYAVGLTLGIMMASWAGLLILWNRQSAVLTAQSHRRHLLKSLLPILIGVVGALVLLVALYPTTCTGTLIGGQPGSPDPNQTWCRSAVFAELGTIRGGSSETLLPNRSSGDVLTRRLTLTALVLSGIPLFGGVAWGWASWRKSNEVEARRSS